jgi:Ca2+-binding RTX toxin-like protein
MTNHGDRSRQNQTECFDELLHDFSHLSYSDVGHSVDGWQRLSAQEISDDSINPALLNNQRTGFSASVYTDGGGNYVVAFRGTENTRDWIYGNWGQANVGTKDNITGAETQYSQAVELAKSVVDKYGENVVFTGHSLGGGLAQAAGLATGMEAVGFNSAGISRATLADLGINANSVDAIADLYHIRNYRIDGDILTKTQETLGLPEAIGLQIDLDDPNPKVFEPIFEDHSNAELHDAMAELCGVVSDRELIGASVQGESYLPSVFEPTAEREIVDNFGLAEMARPRDPLVLDLNNDGILLTTVENSDSFFDIDADGILEQSAWLNGDDGFLALDRNGNGRIDDISELFGSGTTSGFDELRELDTNSPIGDDLGGAAVFDGSPSRIQAEIEIPQGAFSISAVVRVDSFTGTWSAVTDFGTGQGDSPWFGVEQAGRLQFWIGNSLIASSDRGAIKQGVAHEVAVSYDGDEVRLFVDGNLVSVTNTTRSMDGEVISLGYGVGANESALDGVIDEVRLWGRAIDLKAGSGADSRSLQGQDVTLSTLAQVDEGSQPVNTATETLRSVDIESVEFPSVSTLFDESAAVPSGFARSLVDTEIDIGSDYIELDFDRAGFGRFATALENTYVFEFPTVRDGDLLGASINDAVTTLGLEANDIRTEGNRVFINVESLSYNRSSFARIELDLSESLNFGGSPSNVGTKSDPKAEINFNDLTTRNAVGDADGRIQGTVELADVGLSPGTVPTIDATDERFADLSVWRDADGNGQSTPDELTPLADLGITEIELAERAVSERLDGGEVTARSSARLEDGTRIPVADLALDVNQLNALYQSPVAVATSATGSVNLRSFGSLKPLATAMAEDTGLEAAIAEVRGDLSRAGEWRHEVEDILHLWAGTSPPKTSEAVSGARLATLEAITGQAFEGVDGPEPTRFAEPFLAEAWTAAVETLGLKIALQLFSGMFTDVRYSPVIDQVLVSGPLENALSQLQTANPTAAGSTGSERWWSGAIDLLEAAAERGATGDRDAVVTAAAESADSVRSIEELLSGRFGTAADDEINGSSADDVLSGLQGADRLFGSAGNDQLSGGDGPDQLIGDDGNDMLDGGRGQDVLIGGFGSDTLIGGAGADTFELGQPAPRAGQVLQPTQNEVVDFDPATDRISLETLGISELETFLSLLSDGPEGASFTFTDQNVEIRTLFRDVSRADIGQATIELSNITGEVSRIGNGGNDVFWGGAGPSVLRGEGGADRLFGEGGADLLHGGPGDDIISGGDGEDVAVFSGIDTDYIVARNGDVMEIEGPDGTDTLISVDRLRFDNGFRSDTSFADIGIAGRVFLGDGGVFTVSNPAALFGRGGSETILLTDRATNVELDGNIDRIDLPGPQDETAFQVVDGQLQIRASGEVLVSFTGGLNQPVEVRFADGDTTLSQTGATSFALADATGSSVSIDSTATAPAVVLGENISATAGGAPPQGPGGPAANVFLQDNANFTVSDSAQVFGRSGGQETVRLTDAAQNVQLDGNVEQIELTPDLSASTFQVVDGQLQISVNGTSVATFTGGLNQPVGLQFANGEGTLEQTGAATFELIGSGGQTQIDASPVTPDVGLVGSSVTANTYAAEVYDL